MPTILIVDDRRDAQLTIGAKLEGMGFAVKTINSASDIIEHAVSALADIVFMDMNMPEIDGCEASQILRGDERTWSIPILMMSATTTPEERELAIQSGCVDLIAKPIDEDVVKDLLSRLLNSSGAGAELGESLA